MPKIMFGSSRTQHSQKQKLSRINHSYFCSYSDRKYGLSKKLSGSRLQCKCLKIDSISL